jgi:hypothetical protein
LETEALRQRRELEVRSEAWERGWSESADCLRDYLARVDAVLRPYDPLLSAKGAPEEVSARLTRAQREALDLHAVEEAVTWLRRSWPPPSDTVEALFALWELGLAGC